MSTLTKTDVSEKVISIVCEQLDVTTDKVKADTNFIKDLGADSLDQVELVMEFEEGFGINIPDEAAEKIQTVEQAIEFVWAEVNTKGQG